MGVGRPEVVIELGLPKVVRRGPPWADVGRRGPKKLSEKNVELEIPNLILSVSYDN